MLEWQNRKVCMKKTKYKHQINIVADNASFYRDVLSHLGWSITFEDRNMTGYWNELNGELWFVDTQKKRLSETDNLDVRQITIKLPTKIDVDHAQLFLEKRGVKMLNGTPKFRPELSTQKDELYYQIIFESPDKIRFEVLYQGK